MMSERTFRIIVVGTGHGTGEAVAEKPDLLVPYTGKLITLVLRDRQ